MSNTSPSSEIPIDLVLPVYNEAHVLEGSVRALIEASSNWNFPWRILIMDNASIDGTDEVGKRLESQLDCVRFVRLPIKGRGHALRWAWTETDATFSLYMDIDLSTDIAAIPLAVAALQSGADLVTGSRLDPESRVTRSFKRELLSRVYNLLVRLFFWSRTFRDAQCGFKGLRLSSMRPVLARVQNNHWFFDTELMLITDYAGFDLRSIPVAWIEDEDSRVNIVQYVMENLAGLSRLRLSMSTLARELRK